MTIIQKAKNRFVVVPKASVELGVPKQRSGNIRSKVAVLAQKHGLPLAQFLDAARWLLQKDCPYCQQATRILRKVDQLGEERAKELLARVLAAKAANDTAALEAIRKEANLG